MLVQMLLRHRFSPLVLACFLSACSNSEPADTETRLGDSWEGQAAAEIQALGEIPADAPKVVFLGDSLSAGLHLAEDQAFPAVLQRRLVERDLPFHLVNAGVSGDTTAGGLRRIEWILKQYPDVVVVELGGNDGLRGIEVAAIESNLRSIVKRVQDSGVTPVIFGMRIPTSYGVQYSESFRDLYSRVADDMDVVLLPNWLEGVGGDPRYNLPDGLHPNERGHEMLADNIEDQLAEVLEEL
jgi:acyl-CoA thioesterase I